MVFGVPGTEPPWMPRCSCNPPPWQGDSNPLVGTGRLWPFHQCTCSALLFILSACYVMIAVRHSLRTDRIVPRNRTYSACSDPSPKEWPGREVLSHKQASLQRTRAQHTNIINKKRSNLFVSCTNRKFPAVRTANAQRETPTPFNWQRLLGYMQTQKG